jgi:hypothetical protein
MAATEPRIATSALSDDELSTMLRDLEEAEEAISRYRTSLQKRIDFLRGGGAFEESGLEQLRTLEHDEQEIGTKRRQLHAEIDALRAEQASRRLVR